jgi:arsenate reductase-like glutaredoxin family protein
VRFARRRRRLRRCAPRWLRTKATCGNSSNTSGRDYREQHLGEKLPGLAESEALALLAANGNLIKRPFLVGPEWARAGFNESAWQTALAKE